MPFILPKNCTNNSAKYCKSNQSLWRRAYARNISLKTLYSRQFTLSTQLIIPNYLVILSHRRSTTVSWETYPLNPRRAWQLDWQRQSKTSPIECSLRWKLWVHSDKMIEFVFTGMKMSGSHMCITLLRLNLSGSNSPSDPKSKSSLLGIDDS